MPVRSAPSSSIASTVDSTMPVSAPFHPAWAAPITRAFGSANRIGPQSAAVTPMARPSARVTSASPRGREALSPGPDTTMASGEWICQRLRKCAGGGGGFARGAEPQGGGGRWALPGAEKMRGGTPHLLPNSPRIFRDMGGFVGRAEPAVEVVVDAAGHAAVAGKEGVTQARDGR